MKNMTFKKITSQRLFLPIFCLALVLLINIVTTPNFFAIEVRNGVLYGYLIDIINRASELVILAVGMTLVVSSSAGTDISVGAIMAVSAAVCCNLLTGGERAATAYANPLILGFLAALIVGAAIGCFNGFLVAKLNIQPMVATSYHVYRRARYRPADHGWTDHIRARGQLPYPGRFPSGIPGSDPVYRGGRRCGADFITLEENGTGYVHPVGRYQ